MRRGKVLSDRNRGAEAAGPDDPAQCHAQARSLRANGKWKAAVEALDAMPEIGDEPRASVMYASCLG